jgi:hypothetical protein
MVTQMARPWRHPKTGILYYRARIPTDIAPRLRGTRVSLAVGEAVSTVTLSDLCKVSLQTGVEATAKARPASIQVQLQRIWEVARKGTQHLDDCQLRSLARELYADLLQDNEREPGRASDWDFLTSQLVDALRHFDEDDEERFNPKQGEVEVLALTQIEYIGGHDWRALLAYGAT